MVTLSFKVTVYYNITGSLEVFHNLILKFAPKRIHFDKEEMVART